MLQAGKLRNFVSLLAQQTTINTGGERVTEWVDDVGGVWANFTALSAKELLMAGASGNQTTARCIIRYRKDITSAMRVSYNDKIFAIVGDPIPDPKSGKEYLTLMLESVADDR